MWSTIKQNCNSPRCGWHGTSDEVLKAQDPFDPDETLWACPECKDLFGLSLACDEPDCWDGATCGTPTKDGYRNTCGKHVPKKAAPSATA
jgi:hypothetical protein